MSLDRSCGLLGPLILLLARKSVELEAHESPFGPDTLPSYESLPGSGALSLGMNNGQPGAQSSQGILLLAGCLMTFSGGAM